MNRTSRDSTDRNTNENSSFVSDDLFNCMYVEMLNITHHYRLWQNGRSLVPFQVLFS